MEFRLNVVLAIIIAGTVAPMFAMGPGAVNPGKGGFTSRQYYLMACEYLHEEAAAGHVENVSAILQKELIPVNVVNSYGQTALHKAVEGKKLGAIAALMQAGADPHIKDSSGRTAFDLASPAIRGAICEAFPDECK